MKGLILLLLAPLLAAAGPADRSIHEQLLTQYGHLPTFSVDSVVPPTAAQVAVAEERDGDTATVMGYLPYWVAPENIPWDTLDILAWFSVGTNADGSLGGDHGWGDAEGDAVVAAAHAAGVSVVLSTTRFGGEELHPLLSDPAARTLAIDNLVARMIEGGGDGIDVDFEGVWADDKENMVAFVQELRADLDAAQPGSLLTMATPAVDWNGAWDYDELMASADILFIMGYAFAGGWSNPQPNAPLDPLYGSRSLRWSVQDYIQWGGAENAHKVVLGLPLYGHEWECDSPDIGAAATGDDWVAFFDDGLALQAEHGSNWEPISATAWSAWDEGGPRQAWYETPESIGLKATMAFDEGVGGFGFWALNYDAGHDPLWDEVADAAALWVDEEIDPPADDDDATTGDDDDDDDDDATPEPLNAPPVLVIDFPTSVEAGQVVSLDASGSSDPDGDELTFTWQQEWGPEVNLLDDDGSQPHFLTYEPAEHGFSLLVSDGVNPAVEELFAVRVVERTSEPADEDPIEGDGCACDATGGSAFLLLPLLAGRRRRR
jgi:hypothetical protein